MFGWMMNDEWWWRWRRTGRRTGGAGDGGGGGNIFCCYLVVGSWFLGSSWCGWFAGGDRHDVTCVGCVDDGNTHCPSGLMCPLFGLCIVACCSMSFHWLSCELFLLLMSNWSTSRSNSHARHGQDAGKPVQFWRIGCPELDSSCASRLLDGKQITCGVIGVVGGGGTVFEFECPPFALFCAFNCSVSPLADDCLGSLHALKTRLPLFGSTEEGESRFMVPLDARGRGGVSVSL